MSSSGAIVPGPGVTTTPVTNTNNMYRVGDYVFFENSASGPYAIRRIEELNKTQNGLVEARVMCFYRRSEIPSSLIPIADKHHWGETAMDMDQDSDDEDEKDKEPSAEQTERLNMKQREVFLSRQIELLPATLIRGKCSVTLMAEVETIASYINREDAFFYSLVFDPHQKTLQADRGNIRIGGEFQALVPAVDKEQEVRDSGELEDLVWSPSNDLDGEKIDQFVIISRSVGTFARALDCSSSVKQPSLHMSAAAASRDITVMHAYQALHKHSYNMDEALASLVPTSGPVLCRDELEDWSSAEANLFEEAIQKYGKDFNEIKKDFLPWKSMRNIIEYFFMWKTTDRYVQQKKQKAIENENKLKQVYVPAYTRKTQRVTGPNNEVMILGKDCDAYPEMTRYSWSSYKKYGKWSSAVVTTEDCFIIDKSINARLIQNRPGLIIEPGSPAKVGKTRAAFFLRTTPLTRAARRASDTKLSHFARRPNKLIDMKTIRTEVIPLLSSKDRVVALTKFSKKIRTPIFDLCPRMGQKDAEIQEWLVINNKRTPPEKEFFPKPEQRTDGSYIYERIPSVGGDSGTGQGRQQMLYKKRAYEEKPVDSTQATPSKVGKHQGRGYSVNQVAPKGGRKIATMTRMSGGQKTVISWQDAPDDLFFRSTPTAKKTRKQMTASGIRRIARRPFRKIQ